MNAVIPPAPKPPSLYQSYRMRWKRRRLLMRSFRSRRHLRCLADRTSKINDGAILAFSVVRNESLRLPFFLEFYRNLGVNQFLIVDNGSDDGTTAYLRDQPDVSLWATDQSYRETRFGVDWSSWLQMRYGHGHWCLTVDADELLTYARDQDVDLKGLTNWLDRNQRPGFGALMIDLFPKRTLGETKYAAGQDPKEVLQWFDAGPYRTSWQQPIGNLWTQGGTRDRVFFENRPERAPTLNKLPLVKWNRRWAYVNSTHSMLPSRLNRLYDGPGGATVSGALLHTKFLPEIVSKSEIEKRRAQHFVRPQDFDDYYDAIQPDLTLWHPDAKQYLGPDQLVDLGLISNADW